MKSYSVKNIALLGTLSCVALSTVLACQTIRKGNRTPQATPGDYMDLNLAAGTQVLYEAQVRSANACRTDTGADWQKAQCHRGVLSETRRSAK